MALKPGDTMEMPIALLAEDLYCDINTVFRHLMETTRIKKLSFLLGESSNPYTVSFRLSDASQNELLKNFTHYLDAVIESEPYKIMASYPTEGYRVTYLCCLISPKIRQGEWFRNVPHILALYFRENMECLIEFLAEMEIAAKRIWCNPGITMLEATGRKIVIVDQKIHNEMHFIMGNINAKHFAGGLLSNAHLEAMIDALFSL